MVSHSWADLVERPGGWTREQRLWWLLWSGVPGLGFEGLCQLWDHFGSLAVAWAAPHRALARVHGFGPGRLAAIDTCRQRWGADPVASGRPVGRGQGGVLVPGDRAVPVSIKALARPPLALHWQGRGGLWAPLRQRQAVAVVGTRRPSPQGLVMAEAIGTALARAGWPVVSGLAEGIDGAAHQACLQAGGRPVGVLGTGLDRVYPSHHRQLQQQVGRCGLLISEQAPGTRICAGHFAARNRLQVALAQAVVLVECPERSGALQAADMAWRQGLGLWVVPGDAAKRSALGSNRLLSKGVAPLLSADDLVRALGPGPLASSAGGARSPRAAALTTPADQALLAAVGGGSSLEQLSLQLGQAGSQLMPRLLALELAGLLLAEPGLHWRPA